MRKTLSFVVPVLALAATACELQPGQPAYIYVNELEAPWVDVQLPTEMWVRMIPEGDFKGRCSYNFAGNFYNDSRGLICEVNDTAVAP
jgi:hypothetical protein